MFGRQSRVSLVLVLAGVSVVVQLPFLSRGIALLDEGVVLALADELARGEALYRDRITFLGPLSFELMGVLLRVFGSHVLVGRLLQAGILTSCVLLVYAILERVAGRRAAILGGIALLALKPLGLPFWTIVSYSQLGQLFCLASVLLVLRFLREQRVGWLVLAGGGVALTLLTKLNLAFWLGATTALVVGADWLYARGEGPGPTRRGLALAAGASAPLALAALYYAVQGSLDDLLHHTVYILSKLGAGTYAILPPALDVRAARPVAAFQYAPAPLVSLVWERKLLLASSPLTLFLEILVKGAYYVPVLALAPLLWWLLRGMRSRIPREEWSGLLLVTAFAATSYAGILYRADWMHLMNVYPALLVACMVAGSRLGRRSRLARAAGVTLLALWLGAGGAVAAAVLVSSASPLDTARGRLIGSQSEVAGAAPVVRYLESRPVDERIAVLPAAPLYYFLAGRSMPLSYALFLPVLDYASADRLTARELADVAKVVFSTVPIPFVEGAIPEYGPLSAAVLANDFHVERMLAPRAVLLGRRPSADSDHIVADLWDSLRTRGVPVRSGRRRGPGGAKLPALVSWAFYRAVWLPVRAGSGATCVSLEHTAGAREALGFLPLFHPRSWGPAAEGKGADRGAVFEVRARRAGAVETLYREQLDAGPPGDRVRLPLARFSGQPIDLELCAEAAGSGAPVRAAFAEPRIVSPAGPAGGRHAAEER